MIIRVFENWARFTDNGIWIFPRSYSTTLFTKCMQGARARLIDEIIYIVRPNGPAYKIDLKTYSARDQDIIIDRLYNILE